VGKEGERKICAQPVLQAKSKFRVPGTVEKAGKKQKMGKGEKSGRKGER